MNQKPILAGLAGFLDPVLREVAQKLAAKIPQDSPLKNQAFESALGAVKGLVEAYAERFPPTISVAIEKVTDFSDFLAAAIDYGSAEKISANWMDKFFKEAGERLKNSANPTAETEKIKLEFKLRKELLKLIKEEGLLIPKNTDRTTTTATVVEKINSFNKKLEGVTARMRKWAKKGASHGNNY